MENKMKLNKGTVATKFNEISCKAMTDVITNRDFINKIMAVFMVFMFVGVIFTTIAIPGFCGDDAATDIKSIASKIYTFILGISTVLAVVAESIAACMYFFSSDGRKVESAGSWMKRIALGWVFINAMGIIVSLFSGFFSGHDATGVFK